MPKVKTCQALEQGLRCNATFGLEEDTYYGHPGQFQNLPLTCAAVEVWLCPKHRGEPVEPAKVSTWELFFGLPQEEAIA